MVHKKYITRNGKKYGPYLYESKRVDGQVVTNYMGRTTESKYNKNGLYGFILLAILFGIFSFSVYHFSLTATGNAALEINPSYSYGEEIGGNLLVHLRAGELIPKDSRVVFSYNNEEKSFLLGDLVSADNAEGEYYAEDADLSGEGEGYGLIGKRFSYPELSFEFKVVKSENNGKDKGEDIKGDNNENKSEEKEKNKEANNVLTGEAINEEDIVSGEVSKGNDFSYNIGEGESVSLVQGSVKLGEDVLDDNEVSLDVNNGQATVSTDYQIEEEGFGKDYLGEEKITLEIDLADVGYYALNDSTLEISVISEEKTVVSVSKTIDVNNGFIDGIIGEDLNDTIEDLNITEQAIDNRTIVNEDNVTFEIVQARAVIGQPVKWTKRLDVKDIENDSILEVEIPESANNVSVEKIDVNGNSVDSESLLTGGVTAEIKLNKKVSVADLFNTVLRLIGLTGRVVDSSSENGNLSVQQIDVNVVGEDETVIVEYYTDAPQAIESDNERGKTIVVTSPADVHYDDVLVFTNLSETLGVADSSRVQIYWEENSSYISPSLIGDLDENGIYDYIEWIAPHLSNQTFEIIVITNAEHLD